MFTTWILADISNGNLLLGFVPESVGLLIFGFILIAFAFTLRRFFNRGKGEIVENGGEKLDEKLR